MLAVTRTFLRAPSSSNKLSRGLLERLFKRDKAQPPTTIINADSSGGRNDKEKESFKSFVMSKDEEKFLKKRDEFFASLKQKRESHDVELEQRKKLLEEATTAAKREYEITVANLDYNKVIYDNLNIDVKSQFDNVEALFKVIGQMSSKNV